MKKALARLMSVLPARLYGVFSQSIQSVASYDYEYSPRLAHTHGLRPFGGSMSRKKLFAAFALILGVSLLVYLVQPASAAVGFRAAATGNNAGGATTLSIAMPTGTVAGDVMIAVVSVRGGTGTTITPPTDWTQINSNDSTTVLKSAVFRKTAGSGEAGPYVWTFSASEKASGVISSYSGVDTTTPINANANQVNASSTTMTAPTVTTTVTNTMIVAAFSTAVGTTVTAGSSMTERGEDASTGQGAASRTTSQLQDVTQASTGATGTKTATAGSAADNIGHTIALAPAPIISQVGYRFFANSSTAGAVGDPLAAQDAATLSTQVGTPFRLRMLLGVADAQLTSSLQLKLQYKWQSSGSCTSTGNYFDVKRDTPIRFYDNSGVADGASLVSNGNDPVRSGITKVNQTYEETNTFAASTSVPAGQDGLWDFALTTTKMAVLEGSYCIRVVTSTGLTLSAYSAIPTITISPDTSALSANEYRLYQNTDNLTPGSALAATNTTATLAAAGNSVRVRADVSNLAYWRQVSSTNNHTCAIGSDNRAYCWGIDTNGQLGNGSTTGDQLAPVPVDTSGVLAGKTILSIAAGTSHTCAIASDNLPYCWGTDINGELGNGATTGDQVSPVAVDTSGVLTGKTVSSISVGNSHTCVIASDNQAYCWGADVDGELGNGATTGDQVSPVAVDTSGVLSGKTVSSISLGTSHTCAIASDNLAYCWGSDFDGQLGNGATTGDQVSPVAVDTSGVLSGKTILSISSGDVHTCAIASDNLAYCWGADNYVQLGNGATTGDQVSPVAVDTSGVLSGKTFLTISASNFHTCAIASDNQAYCWGFETSALLGDGGTDTSQSSPVAVDTSGVLSGKSVLSMDTGNTHTCVIASDNQLYCWGSDLYGQLGNGATSGTQSVPSTTGNTFTNVFGGGRNNCALTHTGQAYCWGTDSLGELGNGSIAGTKSVPSLVDYSGVLSGKTILSIAAGTNHTCAIASDNQAYCWGSDSFGQLGNGATTGSQVSPVAVDTSGVLSGKTILSITTGDFHACVIASDNLPYCWGYDNKGQLGNGATTGNQVSPVAVDTSGVLSGKTILSITAGQDHTCVVASDNLAYCWGSNAVGKLGNNGTIGADYVSPVAVDTSGVLSGKTVSSISAGGNHTCAIASDNLPYCWGTDGNGALGNGAASSSNQSVPDDVDTSGVLSGKTILSITAGTSHTCAIASDNLPYCWGTDINGELGNGATTGDQVSPVAVDTSGVLSGKTVSQLSLKQRSTCVLASDNLIYCWGDDELQVLGNGSVGGGRHSPDPVARHLIDPQAIPASRMSLSLQYAQKTAGSCSAQTGFASVTGSTVIAFQDNATPSNGATITTNSIDPIHVNNSTAQTYHDSVGTISNVNTLNGDKVGLWDFSLRDNSAPAGTSYCVRIAGQAGEALGGYRSIIEFSTAAGSPGPTLDQMTRGGGGVINGVKQDYSW